MVAAVHDDELVLQGVLANKWILFARHARELVFVRPRRQDSHLVSDFVLVVDALGHEAVEDDDFLRPFEDSAVEPLERSGGPA